jgi:hypothetical protein
VHFSIPGLVWPSSACCEEGRPSTVGKVDVGEEEAVEKRDTKEQICI